MKITCPNCATSYQVPDDYIGTEGRSVRCSSCGKTWHAEPQPEPEPQRKQEPKPEPAAAEPDAGKEQSQDDIDALFDSPSGGGKEQSQDDIDALFDSPSGGGKEQSQDDIDALFDSPSGGGKEQSQDDIDALFDSPSGGGEEQSQDDIDALFDAPASKPDKKSDKKADASETIPKPTSESAPETASGAGGGDMEPDSAKGNASSPFVVKGDGGEDFKPPVVDLLDAAAFEAQKQAARSSDIETSARRRQRRKHPGRKRGSSGPRQGSLNKEWMIGGGALAANLLIIVGLFIAPHYWVKRIPDLASLYSLFGTTVNTVGVDIDMVDVRLEQKAGSPVLSIETELVNSGTEPVILPSVEFSVLGKERLALYSWTIGPDHVGLGPGERKQITTSVAAPAQARYLKLRVFNE